MDIRKDFSSATSHLERLLLYGDEFAKNNRENWPHLKNKEDFKKVYEMDDDSRYKFERIYSRGRDLAIDMSFKLDAFNDVLEYPTITSYVMSFYDENGQILGIKELEEISSQAKQKRDELGYICPWAVEQMILLFDKQLNLLRHISETLELLRTTDIYKIENRISTTTESPDKIQKRKNTQRKDENANKNKSKKSEKSFLETTPGFITAIAALIGAVSTCIAIVLSNPQISNQLFPSPSSTPPAITITATSIETNTPKLPFDIVVTIEGGSKQVEPSFPMNYPPLRGITIEVESADNSIDHCTWDVEWAVSDLPPNPQIVF